MNSPTIRKIRDAAMQLSPLLALVIVTALFGWADARSHGDRAVFLSVDNARTIAVQAVVVGTAALGMLVIIVAGGIDLSAGTALALSATTLAWSLKGGHGPTTAVAAAIGIGCLAGLVNGLLISGLKIVPFIVTLGTMTIYLGVAKMIANETTIRPSLDSVPEWLKGLVTSPADVEWLIYPVLPKFAPGVWLFLALAVLLGLVLRNTVFGRYVFAVGSNESTARLCGINVAAVKIAVYTLAGLFVGVAGMLQFARLKIGNPTTGRGMELGIIAAVVVGGGSLNGGRGTVLGTIAGAVLMVVISTGCTILEFPDAVQDIAVGGIIIAAVALDQLRQRRLGV